MSASTGAATAKAFATEGAEVFAHGFVSGHADEVVMAIVATGSIAAAVVGGSNRSATGEDGFRARTSFSDD